MRSLVPLMPAAIERLAALGYDPAGLARVAALPPDLAFAYHAGAADPPRLPAPFTLDLLPALRGAPRRVIAEHLALYRALDLEAQPALLARVSRLLAEHPDARTLGWLRAAAEHPPELRESFVGALLAASFGAVHPASLPGLSVPAFLAVTPPEHHARWLFAYLGGLRAGVDAAYLLEGLRLAAACPNVPDLTLLAGELGSGSRKAPVIPRRTTSRPTSRPRSSPTSARRARLSPWSCGRARGSSRASRTSSVRAPGGRWSARWPRCSSTSSGWSSTTIPRGRRSRPNGR